MKNLKKFNEEWNPFGKKKEAPVEEVSTDVVESDTFKASKTEMGGRDVYQVFVKNEHGARYPLASISERPSGILLRLNNERYSHIDNPKGYKIKVPSLERGLSYLEELEVKLVEYRDSESDQFDIEID